MMSGMKIDKAFPKQILVALGVGMGLAAYPLVRFGSRDVVVASVVGALLSTANVLLGYLAIEYSLDKSYTTFIKTVIGGMGIRIVGLVGVLLILVKLFGLHLLALTISLLGFYIIYLVLEVLFIQKRISHKA
jgi:hypothetical protein